SNQELLEFSYSIEALSNLQDIGEETAKNIYNFFHYEGNKLLLKKLLEHINIEFKQEIVGGKYAGKKMCITGSFEAYSRDQLVEILEKNGGSFVGSVSKNTDFLLA
ncbi:MAG TPA: BRCT domain-containing protein, partial [Ignavibacteriaceae bacterium]